MNNLSKIYHYTSLNSLALILSNRTIRFNTLANVDDAEEGITADLGNLAKYIYVSSWTKDEDENIALWNMYTPNMMGVRIGVDPGIIRLISKGKNYSGVSNITDFNKVFCFAAMNFCSEVIYSDKENNVKIIRSDDKGSIFPTGLIELGIRKKKLWEFQREVRFLLYAIPKKYITDDSRALVTLLETIVNRRESFIDYVDLELENDAFKNAEFLLGPKTTDAERKIVEALTNTFIPDFQGKICSSNLRIR